MAMVKQAGLARRSFLGGLAALSFPFRSSAASGIRKFVVSRDESIYEAWPDVALLPSGKLVCVFSECNHHGDRRNTRIVFTTSTDRGRTWKPKRGLSEKLPGRPGPYWNCSRISLLGDGRLAVTADQVEGQERDGTLTNYVWFSSDEGETWTNPVQIPVTGIVPDRLLELRHGKHKGRWIQGAHSAVEPVPGKREYTQRCWISDDRGRTWRGPRIIARQPPLELCEGNIIEMPDGVLVCCLRENSGQGLDMFRSISRDGGESWEAPKVGGLPGCHRPTAGFLRSGNVLITYRFRHSGAGGWGWATQNTFAAVLPPEALVADELRGIRSRIMPLDYDRSRESDTGYTGWVQFPDGEIYVVNYIVDDATKGQIRGYSLREQDFYL